MSGAWVTKARDRRGRARKPHRKASQRIPPQLPQVPQTKRSNLPRVITALLLLVLAVILRALFFAEIPGAEAMAFTPVPRIQDTTPSSFPHVHDTPAATSAPPPIPIPIPPHNNDSHNSHTIPPIPLTHPILPLPQTPSLPPPLSQDDPFFSTKIFGIAAGCLVLIAIACAGLWLSRSESESEVGWTRYQKWGMDWVWEEWGRWKGWVRR